jgi:hypothetical protein
LGYRKASLEDIYYYDELFWGEAARARAKADGPQIVPVPVVIHGEMDEEIASDGIWKEDEEGVYFCPKNGSMDHVNHISPHEQEMLIEGGRYQDERRILESLALDVKRQFDDVMRQFDDVKHLLAEHSPPQDATSPVAIYWKEAGEQAQKEFRELVHGLCNGKFRGLETFNVYEAAEILGYNHQVVREWCRQETMERELGTTRGRGREFKIHISSLYYAYNGLFLPPRPKAK